jgi:hypothetical protein
VDCSTASGRHRKEPDPFQPRISARCQFLGRWTTADLHGGFALLESYDIKAIVEFTLGWSDLMELEIVPLIEDVELREVLDRQEARTEREEHR